MNGAFVLGSVTLSRSRIARTSLTTTPRYLPAGYFTLPFKPRQGLARKAPQSEHPRSCKRWWPYLRSRGGGLKGWGRHEREQQFDIDGHSHRGRTGLDGGRLGRPQAHQQTIIPTPYKRPKIQQNSPHPPAPDATIENVNPCTPNNLSPGLCGPIKMHKKRIPSYEMSASIRSSPTRDGLMDLHS
jgi:hypothetical protein